MCITNFIVNTHDTTNKHMTSHYPISSSIAKKCLFWRVRHQVERVVANSPHIEVLHSLPQVQIVVVKLRERIAVLANWVDELGVVEVAQIYILISTLATLIHAVL